MKWKLLRFDINKKSHRDFCGISKYYATQLRLKKYYNIVVNRKALYKKSRPISWLLIALERISEKKTGLASFNNGIVLYPIYVTFISSWKKTDDRFHICNIQIR